MAFPETISPGVDTSFSTKLNTNFGKLTDGSPFYIDDGNNRVGINNSSPSVALDVTGSVKVSGTITNQAGEPLGKITLSTLDPSGGSDGDLWLKY